MTKAKRKRFKFPKCDKENVGSDCICPECVSDAADKEELRIEYGDKP